MKDYSILLYYCYSPIADPEAFREEHHLLCLELNLLGRIIVAAEGLNGTVSGLREDCEKYMATVKADPRFKDIDFKVEPSEQHVFTKLHVRYKPEIVHSSLKHLAPQEKTGIHLSPADFKKMKDQEDVVLLDVRSDYEHLVGKFKNALTLDIENFRDFPEKVAELEPLKDKKVITYCTGGVKCEKASAFLLEQGFQNVYQLHGGIIKYGLEEGGEDFEGKCYVFDNRLTVDVNRVNPKVISRCYICQEPSDRMVNCANPTCNIHVPMCEACGATMEGACSDTCKHDPEKRPYNGTGYYQKETNGYNPFKGLYRKEKK
ncbi:UPF0176 protein YbfQ [Adhaeribacter aerolatus]|uniref:tRNA uridine(34) hydroxylase n=1 Tax=Adhaeribacter aerolatus TaxID=670289 RepID=A0A512B1L5_9BACT|nr:rhodanese-related sulfurtransferase [Adhaeribacter aerolatus]GEO05845.1 UPF0176 protein YbfQ [Adhaeribacter aerolatus]